MITALLKNSAAKQVLIALAALLILLPGLDWVHLFDWDEINFAESAREMLVTGNYLTVQVNFEPFWEKPPLFIWMQLFAMKLFGVNEFAARFPNVLCGVASLLVLFNIGRKLKNERFGWIWLLTYISALFPFFFFKSGIIDPWFNLFIFIGTYFFIQFTQPLAPAHPNRLLVASAFFLGLAILTKGPVGLLIFLLSFGCYLVVNRFKLRYTWSQVALFSVVLILVGCFWFILQIINGNFTIIQDFIVYQIRLFQTQDAGHGGFPLYHFVVLLIGVFPASLFALPIIARAFTKSQEQEANIKHFLQWMTILFWVVLILFSIVRTKIVHYSSMCYFPLTFFAAYYIDRLIEQREVIKRYVLWLIGAFALLFGAAVTLVTQFDKIKHLIIPYVKDEFAVGNMQANAYWIGFESLIGIVLILTAFVFIRRFSKQQSLSNLGILYAGAICFVALTMMMVTPQVEKYSQLAAIEFYQSKRGVDCYIYPTSKSYAHYFYADRQPQNNNADRIWLMTAPIDKPCFFVVKSITKKVAEFEQACPDAKLLYEKNGFRFYERLPQVYINKFNKITYD